MAKEDTRLIGVFVLGAIILVVAAVFLFGSRDLFQKKRYFVAYFEQSVNGLNVGAPIKFRGIEVGQVTSIEGVYNPTTSDVIPRLILEFYPETLRNAHVDRGEYTLFQPLVERGMRASLKSQSLLTGQLYVSLDYYENKALRRLGDDNDRYPEMPTIDSGLGELFAAFEDLPLDALVTQLTGTLSSIENLLSSDGIHKTTDYLPTLLTDLDATIKAIGTFMGGELPATSTQLRSFLSASEESVETLSDRLNSKTLTELELALIQLNATLAKAQQRLDRDDPVSYELTAALRETAMAAASIRKLSDYLESHPEAILRGRSQ